MAEDRSARGMQGAAQGTPDEPPNPAARITPDAVAWAFRLYLGREPRDATEIGLHMGHVNLKSLRTAFAETREFQNFYDTVVKRRKPTFGVPPFLLRPPAEAVPWRFEPPSIDTPVSQLCTAAQFEEPAFAEILQAMSLVKRQHRRVWEQVFAVSVIATEGLVAPGRRLLGLGVRRERLSSLFASRGVAVTAIDAPGRLQGNQTEGGLHLFFPEIIHLEDFEKLVAFQTMDLRQLPADLGGPYDAVWSCGLVQQMGRMPSAMGFIEASLSYLRPGGLAVHAFDFNIGSDTATIEGPEISVPRRRDIEALATRLIAAGHEVFPVNLHPGHDTADGVVDVPPYGLPHLKVEAGDHVVTSFGLVVRKGG